MSIIEAVRSVISGWLSSGKSIDDLETLTCISKHMLYKYNEPNSLAVPKIDEIIRISNATKDYAIIESVAYLCGGTFIYGKPTEKFSDQEIIPNASKCAVEACGMLDSLVNALQDGKITDLEFKAFQEAGKKIRGRLEQLSMIMESRYSKTESN